MDIYIYLSVYTPAMKNMEIGARLHDIHDFLLNEYKLSKVEKKRDWRTYEQQLAKRLREAIRHLEPLIDEATSSIKVQRGKGRKSELSLKQKVILLLLKGLVDKSNRSMASMLIMFSLLTDVDVSYKTIERLYSDPEVEMAIYNLHILILRKKNVTIVDASGDGTGYALTVSKHYASETQKRKDKVKNATTQKKKAFVFTFKLLDLDSRLYICYGTSLRSEKAAFCKAMEMLEKIDVSIASVRLDRYYSFPSVVDEFENASVYIIPRKNSTLKGSWHWKRIMRDFVYNTQPYLGQYYLRNNSESEFSADKRRFGWGVSQRREDRINTAMASINTWHNLVNMHTS